MLYLSQQVTFLEMTGFSEFEEMKIKFHPELGSCIIFSNSK